VPITPSGSAKVADTPPPSTRGPTSDTRSYINVCPSPPHSSVGSETHPSVGEKETERRDDDPVDKLTVFLPSGGEM
jgi:hypothetical protein